MVYCRDAKYLELLLLAQTLHVSDIMWCVSPDIIVDVRRTNFLGSQFLRALVGDFGLDAFLAHTLVKRSGFSHGDEGASGFGMMVTLYQRRHPERRRTTREWENKRKLDNSLIASRQPPHGMWRSGSTSPGI
jgi:hypothetical protein